MHKLQKRFVNRFIARVFLITKSEKLRLFLINISTKSLVNRGNEVELDVENNIYWLKNNHEYLISSDVPLFYFKKDQLYNLAQDFFCQFYLPNKGDTIIDVGAGIGDQLVFFNNLIGVNGNIHSNRSKSKEL